MPMMLFINTLSYNKIYIKRIINLTFADLRCIINSSCYL
jgi:hypothetical protein